MPVVPLTPKSTRTRERILEAALALFAERGFSGTTMRDIAAAADVSLGLTYRYFARKEDLAVALYEGLSRRLAERVNGLQGGTLSERFALLMGATIAELEAHREAFLALAARAFDPNHAVGVLGPDSEPIRAAARESWERLVLGSADPPAPDLVAPLADTLYALNLLVVLIWTQDRDPGRRGTHEAIGATAEALALGRPLLSTPFGAALLARSAGIAGRLTIGRPPAGS
jgi:AcrR family transcriptional regulator